MRPVIKDPAPSPKGWEELSLGQMFLADDGFIHMLIADGVNPAYMYWDSCGVPCAQDDGDDNVTVVRLLSIDDVEFKD